ncbi:MAG: hypothetical protein IJX65_05745 [Alistipes sp.]|nr:hypothetical protein [Alistipes sp.]
MLFGVLFYELRVFTYIDEVVTIAIAAYACYRMFTRRIPLSKPFIIWLIVSFFYLIYSFVIESNVPEAIVNDFVMQSKPYLTFFGLMCIKPKLEPNHYTALQGICWMSFFLTILIYIYHPNDRVVATHGVMLTGEALSAVAILIGTLYYLSCDRDDWVNRFFTILIMSVGVLSPTSKYWGTLIFAIMIIFFVNKPIKLNIKYLVVGALALGVTFYAVKDEFIYYFIEDFEYNARPMLYIKMWDVLADYIPFGSGFATFANPASMIWYSKIYTKYDLDNIWGLDQGNEEHFASDAYYPIFAQFGYVGIVLFIWFFVYLFKQINGFYSLSGDLKRYKTALIIVAYILIQATSNAFANERCVLAMTILVLALFKYKPKPRFTALNSFGLDFANFAPNTENEKSDEDTVNK